MNTLGTLIHKTTNIIQLNIMNICAMWLLAAVPSVNKSDKTYSPIFAFHWFIRWLHHDEIIPWRWHNILMSILFRQHGVTSNQARLFYIQMWPFQITNNVIEPFYQDNFTMKWIMLKYATVSDFRRASKISGAIS